MQIIEIMYAIQLVHFQETWLNTLATLTVYVHVNDCLKMCNVVYLDCYVVLMLLFNMYIDMTSSQVLAD